MATMSAAQSAKQTARQMLTMAQDKARIAAAKTMKGETHVSSSAASTARQMHMDAMSFPPAILLRCNACLIYRSKQMPGSVCCCAPPLHKFLQELDIAIVKATSSSFHVVPKEKHVRSKRLDAGQVLWGITLCTAASCACTAMPHSNAS